VPRVVPYWIFKAIPAGYITAICGARMARRWRRFVPPCWFWGRSRISRRARSVRGGAGAGDVGAHPVRIAT